MAKYTDDFKLIVIQHYLDGKSCHATAQHFNLNYSIVSKWVNLYQAHGIDGIRRRSSKAVYSAEFKYNVVLQILAGKSIKLLATQLNISNAGLLCQWRKSYEQYGIMGLYPKSKGQPPMKAPSDNKASSKPKQSGKTARSWQNKADDDKTTAELLDELAYIRAENAYLKKLDALIRQKQSSSKPKNKP